MPPRKSRSTLTTAARRSQRKARSSASVSTAALEAAVPPPKKIVRPRPSPSSRVPPLFSPKPRIVDEEMEDERDTGCPKLASEVDQLDEWDVATNIKPSELSDGEGGRSNALACSESETEVIENPQPYGTTAVRDVLSESESEPLCPSLSSPNSSPVLFPIDQWAKPASKVVKKESKMKPKPAVPKAGQSKKASKPVSDFEDEIDDSDLVVPTLLVCFVQVEGALKRHEFDFGIDFEIFQYHISNILKVPTWQLELTYSICTMKRGDHCFVSDKEEFASMIHEARNFYDQHIATIRGERLKDVAAAHNAQNRGRVYVRKAPKQIPRLNLTIYNKTPMTEKGAKGKVADVPPGVKIEGLSARTLRIRSELEKKDCGECKQPCVLVPSAEGKPVHKPLSDSHLDLWADHVARGLCTTQRPPPALVLSLTDAQPRTRNRNQGALTTTDKPNSHSTGPTPNPTYPSASSNGFLVPPQYPPYPHTLGLMPPPPGYPPLFYPPLYGMPPTYHPNSLYNTPFGMHPSPYAHNYSPYPYSYQDLSFATPGPTQARPRATSPWLSDWLPRLDAGERGNFGDNFGALASGFAAVGILELAHLCDFTEDDIQQIAFLTPVGSVFYISSTAASQLIQYVREDLSACNFY